MHLKYGLAALVMLLCGFFCFAQQTAETDSVSISENSVVAAAPLDETTITLSSENTENARSERRGNSFFLFLRMIFVLAVVIAVIYGVLFLLKKSMTTDSGDDTFLRQGASIAVAPGKSVQGGTLTDKHAFLIGVSDNSVNLISEIDDLELVQAMNLYSDSQKNTSKPRNFSEILDIFMPGGPRDKESVFSGAQSQISDLLKKQRNRLNGGK